MISQRAPSTGKGLPRTACAPDFFTRIDELQTTALEHAGFPVRWYLGFSTPLPDFHALRGDGMVWQIAVAFGGKKEDGSWLRSAKDIATGVLIILIWLIGFLGDIMSTAKLGLGGKNDPVMREISAEITAKEITARLTGSDPSWATRIDDAARNYLAPTVTLTPGEAVAAYFADVMDYQAAEDYGRLGGVCKVVTQANVETGQQRLGSDQLISLWHRGDISQQRAEQEIRKLGWLSSEYVQWQESLFWQRPQPNTFVSWLRSGFSSEGTADQLQLDKGFSDAYTDEWKKLSEAAGFQDDYVKRLWRGTYQWPQMGEALSWYYRSRAGYITGEDQVDEDDLQDFIQRSTVPPAYHGAVFASRFTPLSSRLLRAAYDEDTATDQQVLSALRADGFSDSDATTLFSEWQQLKPKYTAAKVGLPAIGRLVSLFADATIGTSQFQTGCARLGLNDSQAQEALQGAKNERLIKHRGSWLSTLRASYMAGAIGDSALQPLLTSLGIDAVDAADVAGFWRTEFELRPRPDAAGELRNSYLAGYINESEYVASLTQLRYTPEQIARILYAAEATAWASKMADAEKLVKTAKASLTASAKRWREAIDQAEKWHGKAESRTKTSAGKLMSWISTYVTGTPAKPLKANPQAGVIYAPSTAALATAGQAVEKGNGSTALGSQGIAAVGVAQAAPTASGAAPAGAGTAAAAGTTAAGTGAGSGSVTPGQGAMATTPSIDLGPASAAAGSPPE